MFMQMLINGLLYMNKNNVSKVFRSVLEKISRGIVLKRNLSLEFGGRSLFVSPEGGGLRYWRRDMAHTDPMLLQVVRQMIAPGDVVWDIGGNVGLFAFCAAHKVGAAGQVVVFEPDLSLAALLRRSADANPDLNIDILALAVSAQSGLATFNIARRARATNHLEQSLGSSQTGGIRQKITVPTLSLNDFLAWQPKPNFVKIDVEGAEHLVFRGMETVLRDARPVILCEVHDQNWTEIKQILAANNYELLDAERLPQRHPASQPCFNILALPQ